MTENNSKWKAFDVFKFLLTDIVEKKSVTRLNENQHLRATIEKWMNKYIQNFHRNIQWTCSQCVYEAFQVMLSYESRTRKQEETIVFQETNKLEVDGIEGLKTILVKEENKIIEQEKPKVNVTRTKKSRTSKGKSK